MEFTELVVIELFCLGGCVHFRDLYYKVKLTRTTSTVAFLEEVLLGVLLTYLKIIRNKPLFFHPIVIPLRNLLDWKPFPTVGEPSWIGIWIWLLMLLKGPESVSGFLRTAVYQDIVFNSCLFCWNSKWAQCFDGLFDIIVHNNKVVMNPYSKLQRDHSFYQLQYNSLLVFFTRLYGQPGQFCLQFYIQ